jgi:hypothetical protein
LHATWTEWKNLFTFQIYGHVGKLAIEGLAGRSYGVENLTYYKMLPQQMGAAGNDKMRPVATVEQP